MNTFTKRKLQKRLNNKSYKSSMLQVKLLPLTLVTLGTVGVISTPVSADVIISQYVEGSSFNKALELYNAGTQSENLSDYKLVKYQNGDASNGSNIVLNNITLAAGDVYVIANTSAAPELLAVADQTTGALNFNGDDPVALINVSDNTTADFFGEYGAINFGKDATYSRMGFTALADSVWDASVWSKSAKNDFSGVGDAPTGVVVTPPTFACVNETFTPIYVIQGNGDKSPLIPAGQFKSGPIFTSGVITNITSSLYDGFFIQDLTGDGDVSTSDGVFVHTTNMPSELSVGDRICLSGEVTEFYDSTQINLADNAYEVLSTNNTINPTLLSLDEDDLLHDQLEPYEGMVVTTNNSGLIVSRAFSFDFSSYRNNMVMTYQEPIYKSSHLFEAESPEEVAVVANNLKSTLFIETDEEAPDGVIPYFPNLNAEDGYIRVGDKVSNLEGVVGYSFGQYRLVVNDNVTLAKTDFDHSNNDRSSYGPELDVIGNLRVASFNVLNLFNSPFGGDDNPLQQNRGAKAQVDFDLQLSKISTAISLMDADIIGLMEIENNGFGANSSIAVLVNAINSTQPTNSLPYDYIDAVGFVGDDAISVGIIYRPDVVTPLNAAQKINMPEQHGTDINGEQFDKFQRVSLLQKFTHDDSGETLNIVVNHFKSKGSACIEDSVKEDDVQGNCNAFRVSAAVALGEYLDSNAQGNLLVLGDLNSYSQEDPIRVLTDYDPSQSNRTILTAEKTTLSGATLNTMATTVTESYGMTNLVEHFQGTKAYSYTFSGELGSLDHALANDDLLEFIVAVDDWHINSSESTLFQYNPENTGNLAKSNNAYASSDHDPVIIEIDFEKNNQ